MPWVHYENAPDKWRHKWIYTDSAAIRDAVTEFTEAADAGDREAVKKLFAPNIYNEDGFDEQLDDFLEAYPTGFSTDNADISEMFDGSFEERHTDDGKLTAECGSGGWVTLNGEYYNMYVKLCYMNENDPNEVGITKFYLMSLSAKADNVERDIQEGIEDTRRINEGLPKLEKDPVWLFCDVNHNRDARLINGGVYVFDESEKKLFTEEEIIEAAVKCRKADEEFTSGMLVKELGFPAGYDALTYNPYDLSLVYQLEPENGEPRYAVVNVETQKVRSIDVCGEGSYDWYGYYVIYSKKSGVIKKEDSTHKKEQ